MLISVIYTCSCSYLFQFGPVLTEGNEAYVHHLLIYQCNGLIDTHVGNSGECHEMAGEIQACRGGIIVALWVTGLEVSHYAILNWIIIIIGDFTTKHNCTVYSLLNTCKQEFQYPDNVSYSLGEGSPQYLIMELHYDNPNLVSGMK